MAKFSVGEIAIYVGPYAPLRGSEVEVLAVGPFAAREPVRVRDGRLVCCSLPADYLVGLQGGGMFVDQASLRKRPQRGIPDKVLRLFDVPRTEDATA